MGKEYKAFDKENQPPVKKTPPKLNSYTPPPNC